MSATLQKIAAQLKVIVEDVYRSGIDRVLAFDLKEDNTIEGVFSDRRQLYRFAISPDGKIAYNEAQINRKDSYAMSCLSVLTAGSVRADKADQCKNGKPCGEACIEKGRKCLEKLSPRSQAQLGTTQSLMKGVKQSGGKFPTALLGAAVVAGGAAAATAVVRSRQQGQSAATSATPEPPPAPSTSNSNRNRNVRRAAVAGASLGAATAAYLGVNELDRRYQIKDKAVLRAAGIAYNKLNEYERIDKDIDRLPLNDDQRQKARNMVGAAKVYLAQTVIKRQGGELVGIDDKNNFSTWRAKNGQLTSVGSAGTRVMTFSSTPTGERQGFQMFEMGFRVNNSFNRQEKKQGEKESNASRKEGVRLARLAKEMYKQQLEALPENAFLQVEAWKGDDAGEKRQSIYEKEGFRDIGVRGGKLWAVKNQGKFSAIPDSQVEHIKNLIQGNSRGDSRTDRNVIGIFYYPKPMSIQPRSDDATTDKISAQLKIIIEDVYRSGIDRVHKFELKEGGTVEGLFSDRRQLYRFKISPQGKISYNESEGDRGDSYYVGLASISDYRTDKADQCKNGKACGEACIEKGRECNRNLSPKAQSQFRQTRGLIRAAGGVLGEAGKIAAKSAVAAGAGLLVTSAIRSSGIDKMSPQDMQKAVGSAVKSALGQTASPTQEARDLAKNAAANVKKKLGIGQNESKGIANLADEIGAQVAEVATLRAFGKKEKQGLRGSLDRTVAEAAVVGGAFKKTFKRMRGEINAVSKTMARNAGLDNKAAKTLAQAAVVSGEVVAAAYAVKQVDKYSQSLRAKNARNKAAIENPDDNIVDVQALIDTNPEIKKQYNDQMKEFRATAKRSGVAFDKNLSDRVIKAQIYLEQKEQRAARRSSSSKNKELTGALGLPDDASQEQIETAYRNIKQRYGASAAADPEMAVALKKIEDVYSRAGR